jgi:hypothetical protein
MSSQVVPDGTGPSELSPSLNHETSLRCSVRGARRAIPFQLSMISAQVVIALQIVLQ